jgi:hypothetical protein
VSLTAIRQALEPVIDAFEALGISYQIGGSVASSAYGIARATLDVDIVADLREQHVRDLVERLQGQYYIDEERVREAVRHRSSFNAIHLGSMLKVDVFVLKGRSYDQIAFSRARKDTVEESENPRQFFLSRNPPHRLLPVCPNSLSCSRVLTCDRIYWPEGWGSDGAS